MWGAVRRGESVGRSRGRSTHRSTIPFSLFIIGLFIIGLCVITGCESITGGWISYAEVTVFGTAPAELSGGNGDGGASETLLEGDVEVRLRVFLGGGLSVPITISAGDRTVTVPIGSDAPVSLGRPSLVPGVYQGVRVVFTQVSATLTSGLNGEPSTVERTVSVALGPNGSNPIGPDRSLVLRDGDELQVTVDLRAPDWIGTVGPGPGPGVVPAAVFEQAVRVQARVR